MGLSYEKIMHSTLYKLSFYDDAFELQVKKKDEEMYMLGCYFYEAITTALTNFSYGMDTKHTHKPLKYREKPYLAENKTLDDMTEEELNREIQKAIMAEEMWIKAEKAKGLPSADFYGR